MATIAGARIAPARPSRPSTAGSARTGMSFSRPSAGSSAPRPATASLLARGKTAGSTNKRNEVSKSGQDLRESWPREASVLTPLRTPRRLSTFCYQTMPGAHKPQRPAPPSNDSILQAVARAGDLGRSLRPRTEALAGGRRVETGHVHGEIVDSALVQELHSLSAKKIFSAFVPPSPPASLQQQQEMLTPPTVKRGMYLKGGGSDCDSLSPRGVDTCGGRRGGDETPSYADSPTSAPSPPSAGRYSTATATARARLMEEAKARQLFAASSPSADSSGAARHSVLTPHMRPTGPANWPDVDQQKAAAAEKRQLYREELDMQVSAKKDEKWQFGMPAQLVHVEKKLVNVENPSLGTIIDARKPEGMLAVYENAKAIMPQVYIHTYTYIHTYVHIYFVYTRRE